MSSAAATIVHNVSRKEEVDQCIEAAAQAGAEVIKSGHDTFYAGYFRDPDGHLWEIFWNLELLPLEN